MSRRLEVPQLQPEANGLVYEYGWGLVSKGLIVRTTAVCVITIHLDDAVT